MDLNCLYFRHQVLLIKAQRAHSPGLRRSYETTASAVAGCIGSVQRSLGAAAAPEWQARAVAR